MLDRIRGAFGPAELIFAGGLVCLAIGVALVSVAAAFVVVGAVGMGVGYRWQEPPSEEPAVEEPIRTQLLPGFDGASRVDTAFVASDA